MNTNINRLASAINRSVGPVAPRFTKALVVAVDGNVPTQTVSVQLDGDASTQIDSVAFMDSYRCPAVGDVVVAAISGADIFVLGRFAAGDGLLAHSLLSVNSKINLSVPSNFSQLRIYLIGGSVSNPANGFDDVTVQFNGDSGNDYSGHNGWAVNSTTWSVQANPGISYITAGYVQASNAPGNGGGITVIEIPLYSRASLSKQLVFNSHASSGVGAPNNFRFSVGGGIWGNSQGPITSVQLGTAMSPNTFLAGTEIYVFGI